MRGNDLGRKIFPQVTEVIPQNSEIRMEEERIGTIFSPPKVIWGITKQEEDRICILKARNS